MTRGEHIRIRGAVQGVGFRPTVARLARARGLPGFVRNDGAGVLIGLAATPDDCGAFLDQLLAELPPLARVEDVERRREEVPADRGFVIEASEGGAPRTEVAPDAATCAACLAEARDPFARRYRYPFTNCTHCGPRYTIVEAIPYDRAHTTMAAFGLCAACEAEYADEADRRYHAQPIACHACGPRARLERMDGRPFPVDRYSMLDAVDAAGGLLLAGEIVAVKGLGGYQLCCDATSPAAVERLRARKRRPHKAFALMARDLDVARAVVVLSAADEAVLRSPEAPILLAPKRAGAARPVADAVAPDQSRLGVMLPTSPLHALMLQRVDRPIVCTSGNVTDEPQCIHDDEVRARLGGVADWLLTHDRPIANRVDDSVVARMDGEVRVLRRARGYAPGSLALPPGFEAAAPLLALGGDLKGAFALLTEGRVVLSPHLGDLDHPAAFAAYQDTLDLLRRVYAHRPTRIAFDRHPGYRTHRMGVGLAQARAVEAVEVLHHHAHVAACLAENGWPRAGAPVLGLALDGLGMGEGGELWGGELLLVRRYAQAVRVGTLKPVALLGGDRASREPWRNLYAHLRAEMSWAELDASFGDTEPVRYLRTKPVALLEGMLASGTQAPLASSAGRLFDAVAAAVGLFREGIDDEGQAAMALEARVTPEALAEAKAEPYPFALPRLGGDGLPYLEPLGMWRAVLGDLWAAVDPSLISARFHVGLAEGLVRLVGRAAQAHGVAAVALSGGCFANRVLLELTAGGLRAAGLEVLTHRRVPPNDGGLALGQAVLAAARSLDETEG
ncbi:MAG: carbamoyltransferase HypF [Sandaracinaceae bacterium]